MIDNESLFPAFYFPFADVDYTFESKANHARSVVDHFVMSHSIVPLVRNYSSIHDIDNFSDHSLISLDLSIPATLTDISDERQENVKRYRWDKATHCQIENYKFTLDENLDHTQVPLEAIRCTDVHCKNPKHLQYIERYHNDIVNASCTSSEAHIPLQKKRSKSS